MSKISFQTSVTKIVADSYIKPTAPEWFIRNNGFSGAWINNSYYIGPGGSFGVACPTLTAKLFLKGLNVVNETQMHITFDQVGGMASHVDLVEIFPKS